MSNSHRLLTGRFLGELAQNSWRLLKGQPGEWAPYFLFLIFFNGFDLVGELFFAKQEMTLFFLDLLRIIGMSWIQACLVLHILLPSSAQRKVGERLWEGFCATPRFLLYSLFLLIRFCLGALLFLIPGLYFVTVYFYAPYLAVYDPEAEQSYFKWSQAMAKGRFLDFFVLIFIIELLPSFFSIFTIFIVGPLPIILDIALVLMESFLFLICHIFMILLLKSLLAEQRGIALN